MGMAAHTARSHSLANCAEDGDSPLPIDVVSFKGLGGGDDGRLSDQHVFAAVGVCAFFVRQLIPAMCEQIMGRCLRM